MFICLQVNQDLYQDVLVYFSYLSILAHNLRVKLMQLGGPKSVVFSLCFFDRILDRSYTRVICFQHSRRLIFKRVFVWPHNKPEPLWVFWGEMEHHFAFIYPFEPLCESSRSRLISGAEEEIIWPSNHFWNVSPDPCNLSYITTLSLCLYKI